MKPIIVYLAGSLEGGWQDLVMKACEDLSRQEGIEIEFFDPRINQGNEKYRLMNKEHWERADIIFGYAKASDPLLFDLYIEIAGGYSSKARTIFVDGRGHIKIPSSEKTSSEKERSHCVDFIDQVSHTRVVSLEGGIAELKTLIWDLTVNHSINKE